MMPGTRNGKKVGYSVMNKIPKKNKVNVWQTSDHVLERDDEEPSRGIPTMTDQDAANSSVLHPNIQVHSAVPLLVYGSQYMLPHHFGILVTI